VNVIKIIIMLLLLYSGWSSWCRVDVGRRTKFVERIACEFAFVFPKIDVVDLFVDIVVDL
jgi:hypothetical protein